MIFLAVQKKKKEKKINEAKLQIPQHVCLESSLKKS